MENISIVLTDGKIITINATDVDWCEKTRMVKLFKDRKVIARINMDNVVGWINTDCMAKSGGQVMWNVMIEKENAKNCISKE